VVDLGIDRVLLPNGYTAEIELIRHGGAAAVVPVFEDGTVLLIRQYRHAAGRYLLEIPAGRLEPGEQPEDCARRELQEETGYRAARLTLLLPLLTTPGFTDECISLFLAEGLEAGEAALEADECIERVRVPFPVVLELLRTGGLVDAKSIVGLMTAALRLGWLEAGGP
jgi:ADP-ribose pyrophosphatase